MCCRGVVAVDVFLGGTPWLPLTGVEACGGADGLGVALGSYAVFLRLVFEVRTWERVKPTSPYAGIGTLRLGREGQFLASFFGGARRQRPRRDENASRS